MDKNNANYREAADKILEGLKPDNGKGIFARIPRNLHDEISQIKEETGKSLYEIVELSLRLFIVEYRSRKAKGEKKV